MPCQISSGRMVLGIQRDQNLGIACADGAARTVRLIDSRVRQSNVVQNCLQVPIRNLLAQRILNLIAQPRCLLHSQARTSTHMQTQQPCIDLRKEILSKKAKHSEGEDAEREKTNCEYSTMRERGLEQ